MQSFHTHPGRGIGEVRKWGPPSLNPRNGEAVAYGFARGLPRWSVREEAWAENTRYISSCITMLAHWSIGSHRITFPNNAAGIAYMMR